MITLKNFSPKKEYSDAEYEAALSQASTSQSGQVDGLHGAPIRNKASASGKTLLDVAKNNLILSRKNPSSVVIKGFIVPSGQVLYIEMNDGTTKEVQQGQHSGGHYSYDQVKTGQVQGWKLVDVGQAQQQMGAYGAQTQQDMTSAIKQQLNQQQQAQQQGQQPDDQDGSLIFLNEIPLADFEIFNDDMYDGDLIRTPSDKEAMETIAMFLSYEGSAINELCQDHLNETFGDAVKNGQVTPNEFFDLLKEYGELTMGIKAAFMVARMIGDKSNLEAFLQGFYNHYGEDFMDLVDQGVIDNYDDIMDVVKWSMGLIPIHQAPTFEKTPSSSSPNTSTGTQNPNWVSKANIKREKDFAKFDTFDMTEITISGYQFDDYQALGTFIADQMGYADTPAEPDNPDLNKVAFYIAKKYLTDKIDPTDPFLQLIKDQMAFEAGMSTDQWDEITKYCSLMNAPTPMQVLTSNYLTIRQLNSNKDNAILQAGRKTGQILTTIKNKFDAVSPLLEISKGRSIFQRRDLVKHLYDLISEHMMPTAEMVQAMKDYVGSGNPSDLAPVVLKQSTSDPSGQAIITSISNFAKLFTMNDADNVQDIIQGLDIASKKKVFGAARNRGISPQDLVAMSAAEFKTKFAPYIFEEAKYDPLTTYTDFLSDKELMDVMGMYRLPYPYERDSWRMDIANRYNNDYMMFKQDYPDIANALVDRYGQMKQDFETSSRNILSRLPKSVVDALTAKTGYTKETMMQMDHADLAKILKQHVDPSHLTYDPTQDFEKPVYTEADKMKGLINLDAIPKYTIKGMKPAESRLYHFLGTVSGEGYDETLESQLGSGSTTAKHNQRMLSDYLSGIIEDMLDENGFSSQDFRKYIWEWTSGRGGSQSVYGMAIRYIECKLSGADPGTEFNMDKVKNGTFWFDEPALMRHVAKIKDTYTAAKLLHQQIWNSLYPNGKEIYRAQGVPLDGYNSLEEKVNAGDMDWRFSSLCSATTDKRLAMRFTPQGNYFDPKLHEVAVFSSMVTGDNVGINLNFHMTRGYMENQGYVDREEYTLYASERELIYASNKKKPVILDYDKQPNDHIIIKFKEQ